MLKLRLLLSHIPANHILHCLHSLQRVARNVNVKIFLESLEVRKFDSQKRAGLLELSVDASMIDAHVPAGKRIEESGEGVLEMRGRALEVLRIVSVVDRRSK